MNFPYFALLKFLLFTALKKKSLNLLLSKVLLSSQKRKRDVVWIAAVIETPLVPAENAPSSSGWHSNVVLLLDLIMSFLCTVFSWAFPSYMLKFDFFLYFFYFVWVLTIFLDPYNHDSLLSSQTIRRRRSSPDLNSQPTASQPYQSVVCEDVGKVLFTLRVRAEKTWGNSEHFLLFVWPQLINKCCNIGHKGCKLASQI
jgi:hypothetical protein